MAIHTNVIVCHSHTETCVYITFEANHARGLHCLHFIFFVLPWFSIQGNLYGYGSFVVFVSYWKDLAPAHWTGDWLA